MKRIVILFVAVAFVALCMFSTAQQPRLSHIRLNERAAKKMAREAKSPEEYRAAAEYYRELHDDYDNKAKAEKAEWIRRSEQPWLKNPSPESARGLYEYYHDKAAKFSELSSKYSKMAEPAVVSTSR